MLGTLRFSAQYPVSDRDIGKMMAKAVSMSVAILCSNGPKKSGLPIRPFGNSWKIMIAPVFEMVTLGVPPTLVAAPSRHNRPSGPANMSEYPIPRFFGQLPQHGQASLVEDGSLYG